MTNPNEEVIKEILKEALKLYIHFDYIDFQSRSNAHKGSIEWINYVSNELLKLDNGHFKHFILQALQKRDEENHKEIDRVLSKYYVEKEPLCEQNVLIKLIKDQLLNQ